MLAVDPRVADALERVVPRYDGEEGDWKRVLAAAEIRRRWMPRATLAFVVAAAAAIAVVLAWPSGAERGGILERALAAAGDGPVLHAVFAEEWGGMLVDLTTGRRRELRAEREVWYDPQRGLHEITRLDGVVEGDRFTPPGKIARYQNKTLTVLAEGYRDALASGRARVLGADEAYGIPVYWIRVDEEWLPDVADGKLHEWAHDVAVSRESYEPVATRETRDRNPGPLGTRARIVEFETLPSGEGNFDRPATDRRDGMAIMCCGTGIAISLAEAHDVIGRSPLWLGRDFRGLRLVRVARGEVGARPAGGERWDRMPVLDLFYGKLTDEGRPDFTRPHVRLQQASRVHPALGRGGYVPPEGSAFVTGSRLLARVDGVFVDLEAAAGGDSDEFALAAARALERIPSS